MKFSFRKLVKLTASLKFAVVTIIAIAILTAIGTFVEAEYNASIAQKLVYKSPYMYIALGVLCVTLIAVMIDRWPWRKHHTGFILAHIGIIIVLSGAWVTQKFGVDGSMKLEAGESQKYVTIPDTRLVVYASYDGDNYRTLFSRDVDFFLDPPAKHPLKVPIENGFFEVVDSMPFAIAQSKVVPSKQENDPPAVRFQLENQMVNQSQWLTMKSREQFSTADLGPAQVIIAKKSWVPSGRNEIAVWPAPNDSEKLSYAVYSKEKKLLKSGQMKMGESVDTGWMGLVFRVLDYYRSAREETTFVKLERPTSISTSAIQVRFLGETHWVGLNSLLKLFSPQTGFIVAYQNKLIDVGFDLKLDKFEIGRYQGTMRAASYQSLVTVPTLGQRTISMNEPLKFNGFTFYQASFEEDPMGRPLASILSVNYDPGRVMKYLGSLLIVLGTIVMFYFKKRRQSASTKAEGVAA